MLCLMVRTIGFDGAERASAIGDDDDVGALRDAVVAVRVVVRAAYWRIRSRHIAAVACCAEQRLHS